MSLSNFKTRYWDAQKPLQGSGRELLCVRPVALNLTMRVLLFVGCCFIPRTSDHPVAHPSAFFLQDRPAFLCPDLSISKNVHSEISRSKQILLVDYFIE